MSGSGSIKKVILVGRLGKDAEVKYTAVGMPIAHLLLATGASWTDQAGQTQKRAEWHRVIAWNKLAEICGEYLLQGKQVYVEGQLRSRTWEDKAGVKHTVTEIIANQVVMLGSKNGNGSFKARRMSQASVIEDGLGITDEDFAVLMLAGRAAR